MMSFSKVRRRLLEFPIKNWILCPDQLNCTKVRRYTYTLHFAMKSEALFAIVWPCVLEYTLFYKTVLGKSARHFFENIRHKISKKYLKYKIRLKMVHWEQFKVYYIKMAGKWPIWIWWDVQTIFRNIATNLVNMKVFFTKNSL